MVYLDAVRNKRTTDRIGEEVIAAFLARETADGAPAPAVEAERLAAESGFTFGVQVLGPLLGDGDSGQEISRVLDGMYLLALIDLVDEAAPSFNRLGEHLADQAGRVAGTAAWTGAHEEALPLAWCVGFGATVVMADRSGVNS